MKLNQDFKNKLAEYYDQMLDLKKAKLSDEYFYQSLPLCVIDAVYSIGVRYDGTKETVRRYCNHFNLRRIKKDKDSIPSQNTQESIETFLKKMTLIGPDNFAKKIFGNRQRTSTKNGILKSEAVYRFAKTLKNHGVNYFQDVTKVINSVDFEKDIKSIPGQGSGISLRYFFMLSGSDNLIKPDRHILAFLKKSLRKTISPQYAQILLTDTCNVLKLKYPHLTPRLLDHEIWKYQKSNENHSSSEKSTVNYLKDEKPMIKIPDLECIRIGPYQKSEMVLCSADAGPSSQLKTPGQAGYFFPGGKWVGAVRNAAERLRCRFVILTGHGMVNPHDIITPYDMHFSEYEEEIRQRMIQTIPELLGKDSYKIVILYSGGVPRQPSIKIIKPILHDLKIDLLTFGRPNMYDVNKIENVVELLTNDEETTLEEIRKILKLPDRLEFFSHK